GFAATAATTATGAYCGARYVAKSWGGMEALNMPQRSKKRVLAFTGNGDTNRQDKNVEWHRRWRRATQSACRCSDIGRQLSNKNLTQSNLGVKDDDARSIPKLRYFGLVLR